ncbi:carboxylesterase/lipase family protein [Agromyces sp. S2-1-8]|uniref:carboxylesterase/lipase family protein n=1 Tax=Agromyces sp. S2-1-8 TaxID=2897180 RepID=UPI001E28FC12|nr:carboxylesterase family protein [Agromyces sp. S2-1-8]MCD5345182.1 carboxylesterase family protein [Agromyces sp. S2-1-8]
MSHTPARPGTSTEQDASAASPFVEVDTLGGRVRGRWRPTVRHAADASGGRGAARSAAFLGIPFAEAPVGELRFAAPVPKAPWAGVRDALEFAPTAQRGDPGVTLIPEPSIEGDSTLNVNVFTPSPERPAEGDAGLPVLVWIHGGGYFAGSPASPWYDGRNFNRDGVVTVTISYRLGFDGFGWIADAPSNRGVRDWLLALEWVQQNIAAFGGDPARVTIAGQSAGGGAVLTLLGMEAAQHLFHGVYAISGATADVTPSRAEALGRRVAAELGVEPTLAGFRSVSEERLIEVQKSATAPEGPDAMNDLLEVGLQLGPAIDGELLRRSTIDSFAAGVGADKPLVLGATDDEFAMALLDAPTALRFVPKSMLLKKSGLSKSQVRPYLDANREVAKHGNARLLGRLITDRMFKVPMLRAVAARAAATGATDGPTGGTWLYRFAWPSGTFGFAEHCLDVPFFFDCLDGPAMVPLAGPNPPQALADELHAGAVAFVVGGSVPWAPVGADPHAYPTRVYDTPSIVADDGYASVRPLL